MSIKIRRACCVAGGHEIDIPRHVGSSYLGNGTCQSRECILPLVNTTRYSGYDSYWRED